MALLPRMSLCRTRPPWCCDPGPLALPRGGLPTSGSTEGRPLSKWPWEAGRWRKDSQKPIVFFPSPKAGFLISSRTSDGKGEGIWEKLRPLEQQTSEGGLALHQTAQKTSAYLTASWP